MNLTEQNITDAVNHSFTGLYWDYQTNSYMFFVCGILVVQLSKDGDILYAVEKQSPYPRS